MAKIYSDRGEYEGSIDSRGRIRDEHGDDKGRIEKDGCIYDEHGKYIGVVWENGYIYIDGTYYGLIDDQGNIMSQGKYIGHIEGYEGFPKNTDKNIQSGSDVDLASKKRNIINHQSQRSRTSAASNPLMDSITGGFCIFLIAIVIAIVTFVGTVFKEAFHIIDSSGIVLVLLLAFIGTWITDLVCNRNNKGIALKTPIWGYMLTNYSLMIIALLIIKQGNTRHIFTTLCVTFILAVIMTLCSMIFHFTYRNEANTNVKAMFILIPVICLFAFSFYANSQGLYPYQMNSDNYSEEYGEEMPGEDADKYSFDSNGGEFSADSESEDEDSESTDTDSSDIDLSEDETLDYVDANNSADFSKCLSPSDYTTFETENGDTIAYPKNFFTNFTSEDGEISFTSQNEFPRYNIYINTADYDDPIEEVENKISEYKSDLDKVTYQYPSDESDIKVGDDGYAKTVLAGMWDESSNIKAYYVIASDGTDTKIMEFKYELMDDATSEGYSDQDYMIDCLYRGTSFTGSTYKIRTYGQFIDDDLGDKK